MAMDPNPALANINERLLLLLQQILARHHGTEAEQSYADVNQRILGAVANLFPDGGASVSMAAFRQVQDACSDGVEMSGPDSPDARDYREICSAVSNITQEHGP